MCIRDRILALGLVGFVFDTVGGVFFAKFLNLFSKKKVNPCLLYTSRCV